MSHRPAPPQPSAEESRSQPVSAATVPLLFGGLVLGFLAGYFLTWWGALVVVMVVIGAISAVLSGRSRDAATGAILGTVLGYLGVIAVALFRGAL